MLDLVFTIQRDKLFLNSQRVKTFSKESLKIKAVNRKGCIFYCIIYIVAWHVNVFYVSYFYNFHSKRIISKDRFPSWKTLLGEIG